MYYTHPRSLRSLYFFPSPRPWGNEKIPRCRILVPGVISALDAKDVVVWEPEETRERVDARGNECSDFMANSAP